jgi:hypothetical protein
MPTLGSYLNASVLLSPKLQDSELKAQLDKLQATVKSRLKDPDVKVKLDSAEAQAKMKKLQADMLQIANRKVSIDLKTAQAEAKIAAFRAFAEKESGNAGKNAGENFAQKMSNSVKLGHVAIGAALLGSLSVLPALAAGAGIGAGLAVGGALVAGLLRYNPLVKHAAKSLGHDFQSVLNASANSSGFTSSLTAGINRIRLQALPQLGKVFRSVFAAIRPLIAPATDELIRFARWIADHINPGIAKFRAFIGQLRGPTGDLIDKLQNKVWPNIAKFIGQMARSAGSSVGAFGNLLVAISPLLPALGAMSGLAAQLLNKYPRLIPVLGAVALAIKVFGIVSKIAGLEFKAAMMGTVVGILIVAAALIIQYHTQIWHFIQKAWNAVKNVTVGVWNSIFAFFKRWWPLLIVFIAGPLGVLVAEIVVHWHSIANVTKSIWNAIFNFFKGIWGHIENVVTGAVKSVINWVTTGWNTVANTTHRVWSGIANTISGTWNGIKNGVGSAVDWVKKRISDGWNWVAGTTGRIWGGLGHIVSTAFNAVKGAIVASLDWGIDRVNQLIGAWDSAHLGPLHLPHIDRIPGIRMARGGKVPGFAPGSDTVPAMLSPGEFVVNPIAAKAVGYDRLHELNATKPGSHAQSAMGQMLATGGQVASAAVRWNGHPYHWGGGANPSTGWDCSSFTDYIMGSLGVPLPGGFRAPSAQHGPATGSWLNYGSPVPYGKMAPGDVYVNGHHMGIVTGLGRGFAARSTATGTGPQLVPPGAYSIRRVVQPGGFFSGIAGAVAAAFSAAQSAAIASFLKLSAQHPKAPGTALSPVGSGFRNGIGDAMHNQVQSAFQAAQAAQAALFNGPTGGNPSGNFTSGVTSNGQAFGILPGNLLKAAQFFTQHGYSKMAAAGIAGNMAIESGGDPEQREFGHPGNGGLIGFTPLGKSGARITGNVLADFNNQLGATLNYNNAIGGGSIRALNSQRTAQAAALYYEKQFERPLSVSASAALREGWAGQVFAHLAKGGVAGKRMATGGVINEKVLGFGAKTGTPFTLGENGRERVMPERAMLRYEQDKPMTSAQADVQNQLLRELVNATRYGNENLTSAITGVGRGVHRTR